jgi:hypothetical protein
MWIPRTSEETQKWQDSTAHEARVQSLIYAGGCWLAIAALLAGGCMAGANFGIIAQDSVSGGSFWSRLPSFALPGIPVAYWLFRRNVREELARAKYMTICPKCEKADDNNEGQACDCGGTFVAQSSVRWVDDEQKT